MEIAREYGLTPPDQGVESLSDKLEALYDEAALFASMRIVEKMETFAEQHGKQTLYVLSHTERHLARALEDGSRSDLPFVEFLRERGLPHVDLMDRHIADHAKFSIGVQEYLSRYYIGHYNPMGNHFTAFAIKDELVELLESKPPAYND